MANVWNVLTATVFFLLLPLTAVNGGEEEDKRNATELGRAVYGYLVATYACQDYMGGSSVYRTAKITAESILLKTGVDRNKAVLIIQECEDAIKSQKIENKMEKIYKRDRLIRADAESALRKNSC